MMVTTIMIPAQSIAKETTHMNLGKLCEQISNAEKNNNGKRPYGLVSKLVNETKSVCP